ncbi:MAG TPA: alpha/beta hydrolase [Vicinamibacterales bacterium]|nr:alpha/beta hydrolase [Vicinamibacterales bacterium]
MRIAYVAAGRGEPVLLMHGLLVSMEPTWLAGGVFDALSTTNRCVAFDLRGHGRSGKPHDSNSYGLEMVRDVLRLMDHLGIERAHVVGYSLGAILGAKLLELAPHRLLSLAMGGAGWVRSGDSVHRGWTPLADSLASVTQGTPLSAHFWPDPASRPPKEIQQVIDGNDPAALAAVARGMTSVTLCEQVLRANVVPVFAICGDHDPAKASVMTMSAVTGCFALHLVPGADHHSLPARPEFLTTIRAFISDPMGALKRA